MPTPAELARAAYESLEPYHLVSYFTPHLKEAGEQVGLDGLGYYVGCRAEPLGRCHSSVVNSTFHNFNPGYIQFGWKQALSVGLDVVARTRTEVLDRTLREALGDLVDSPELPGIVSSLRAGITEAPYVGRSLAAAWAAAPWPDAPHLQFWHATSVIREFRGDGHIAALVLADLGPVEALVFHESPQPREIKRSTLGKKATLATRGWTEDDWAAAAENLRGRGLLDGDTLSAGGVELYDRIEAQTDDAAAPLWRHVPDAERTLAAARPFVKAVIKAGILPGTKR